MGSQLTDTKEQRVNQTRPISMHSCTCNPSGIVLCTCPVGFDEIFQGGNKERKTRLGPFLL